SNRVLFIHKMILELGIIKEQEWVQWLEKMIPQLKQFAVKTDIGEK
ncbi:MAG TPA: PadR family transcriptional regulator, partial [Acinetobacter sp.]|nr:PadR family transcriptional regulator [Acinetobacter sp.]